MIGRLRGILLHKQPPQLLIEAGGVGYELEASLTTFAQLPVTGSEVTLFTHLAVRDDAHLLYGFVTRNERALFRHLIRVNGVGAKVALLILSGMDTDTFIRCVNDGDSISLTRLPGIGRKTAERLIVEMRDRLNDLEEPGSFRTIARGAPASEQVPGPAEDAVAALVALGYKPADAGRMIKAVAQPDGLSSEQLIRRALQTAVRR